MCLILLAYRAHPDTAVLLAGNRDEFYHRPSAPPAQICDDPPIFAGRDLEAGGTWMGRNGAGMLAALTNGRRFDQVVPPNPRSRGELVTGLLRQSSAAAAADWLTAQPLERFRPFNVLFGDVEAFYYYSSLEGRPVAALAPGMYALSNSTLNDSTWPKVAFSLGFLRDNAGTPGEELLRRVQRFLCDGTPPDQERSDDLSEEVHGALGAVFIRTANYGTVSQTILTEGGTLGRRYYFSPETHLQQGPRPVPAFRRLPF
ncbi:MAG: NRDE family protein [Candidatus Lambdaproteobacteria bacterium]|nr:NRDE family protein [Candidatus Lambdaproteobacteria bacterium]